MLLPISWTTFSVYKWGYMKYGLRMKQITTTELRSYRFLTVFSFHIADYKNLKQNCFRCIFFSVVPCAIVWNLYVETLLCFNYIMLTFQENLYLQAPFLSQSHWEGLWYPGSQKRMGRSDKGSTTSMRHTLDSSTEAPSRDPQHSTQPDKSINQSKMVWSGDVRRTDNYFFTENLVSVMPWQFHMTC